MLLPLLPLQLHQGKAPQLLQEQQQQPYQYMPFEGGVWLHQQLCHLVTDCHQHQLLALLLVVHLKGLALLHHHTAAGSSGKAAAAAAVAATAAAAAVQALNLVSLELLRLLTTLLTYVLLLQQVPLLLLVLLLVVFLLPSHQALLQPQQLLVVLGRVLLERPRLMQAQDCCLAWAYVLLLLLWLLGLVHKRMQRWMQSWRHACRLTACALCAEQHAFRKAACRRAAEQQASLPLLLLQQLTLQLLMCW